MIKEEPMAEAIQVVTGNPTPAELAAVVAILEAAHAEQVVQGKRELRRAVSSWNRNSRIFRNDLQPGSGQWKAQYRPGLD